MTELDGPHLERLADAYERTHPMAGVEATMFETVPDTLDQGELQWRDVEWMVRWYYRRHLTSRLNERRQSVETAFLDNEWPIVKETLESTSGMDDPKQRVTTIAALEGIDIGVASGILYFLDFERDIVMGRPEWCQLAKLIDLEGTYPKTASPDDYTSYLEHCRSIAETAGVDLRTVQRALWQLSTGADTL